MLEPPTLPEPAKREVRLGLDVFTLLFYGCVAAAVMMNAIDYLAGQTNYEIEARLLGTRFAFGVVTSLLLVFCIVSLLVRLVFQWKYYPAWIRASRCIAIVLMCFGVPIAFSHPIPITSKLFQKFEEKMRTQADVKAIRAWGLGLDVPGTTNLPDIEPELWPRCVNELSPQYVYYMRQAKRVRLVWGGGFLGHYSLVVGPKDLPTPETDRLDTIIPLEAGAYLMIQKE